MTTDKTPVQQHLADVDRYSDKAERLLTDSVRVSGHAGVDYAGVAVRIQAAAVYAQLAQVAATAALLPGDSINDPRHVRTG